MYKFSITCLLLSALILPFPASAKADAFFKFDLLEDLSTFRVNPIVFDGSGTQVIPPAGVSPYGSGFVVKGHLYKAGTLRRNNCVNDQPCDLSGETPIGEWTCFGRLMTDLPTGLTANTAATVGAQYFYFNDINGKPTSDRAMVSTGLIYGGITPGLRGVYSRPVTGGTGDFRFVSGDLHVEVINFDGPSVGIEYEANIIGVSKPSIRDLQE